MATPNEMKFAEAWRALNEETTKPGWNTLPIATNSASLLLAGRHHPQNQESMLIGFTVAGLPKQASSTLSARASVLKMSSCLFKVPAITVWR